MPPHLDTKMPTTQGNETWNQSVEDEPTKTQIGKLGSVSFGSWWCGAGNDPRTSLLLGRDPTMRKGSYSEELVKIVRFHVCSR